VPLGILLVNVVSVSSSIAALTALAVLYAHLRSRGVLLLAAAVLFLTIDYTLGLVLFASPDSSLWRGLPGIPVATRSDAVLMGLKGMLQVGVLCTGPLAVSSFFGWKLPRLVLWTGAALALAALVPSACMAAGLFPDAWGILSALSAVPGYVAYAACFVILLANRKTARPGLSRGIVRAAVAAFAVVIPLLLANDVLAFAGRNIVLLPSDALGFLVLSGGVLVCTLLVLLGRRRTPGPVDLDAFCRDHGLSVREREVLVLLAEGLRYKQIADRLGISLDTVKSHASRVYRKSEASGRTDLLYRIRLGGR
jgi:DNA-binding CsgD family transcriptional regulator